LSSTILGIIVAKRPHDALATEKMGFSRLAIPSAAIPTTNTFRDSLGSGVELAALAMIFDLDEV